MLFFFCILERAWPKHVDASLPAPVRPVTPACFSGVLYQPGRSTWFLFQNVFSLFYSKQHPKSLHVAFYKEIIFTINFYFKRVDFIIVHLFLL